MMDTLDKIRSDFESKILPLRVKSGLYIKALADDGVTEIDGRPIEDYMKDWSELVQSLPEDDVRRYLAS